MVLPVFFLPVIPLQPCRVHCLAILLPELSWQGNAAAGRNTVRRSAPVRSCSPLRHESNYVHIILAHAALKQAPAPAMKAAGIMRRNRVKEEIQEGGRELEYNVKSHTPRSQDEAPSVPRPARSAQQHTAP